MLEKSNALYMRVLKERGDATFDLALRQRHAVPINKYAHDCTKGAQKGVIDKRKGFVGVPQGCG